MTKKEFIELMDEVGFVDALNELADQSDEIAYTNFFEMMVVDCVTYARYEEAEEICKGLQQENCTDYWTFTYDHNLWPIIEPVNRIADVEHLFEEEDEF